ncbi:hypothetical protein HOP50_02g11220 [Chloropicon primus]|uniref:TOG domain-containing protein n=1 Tax=Chloropicon primus TaxID=1764295 RepID=A0A5B8MDF0_9CHLO|nr:hypothetical protein A3770_02p11360 [Chloropicon primus]UPQ97827.1 hypothetical protein HOP50_02g11220 [Chloropicon primus]|eukprot:QDZ18618.1 hypothetical protein A3770_02p11360 [Chloropicon primus]
MKLMKAQPIPGTMTQFNYSNMQASEETLNVVVTALLTINHEEFDFGSMLPFLTNAVGNESQRTGSVALEAIAVVNKITGSRFSSLLSSCNVSERVQNRITERVQNDSLPVITSDGTVQYSWSSKPRRILNNENKNTVAMLRKNSSPKDAKTEYLNGGKPLLRRKENLGLVEVPYSEQRGMDTRRVVVSNGTTDYDQLKSTRSDIMPLSNNEMDAISKYDSGAYTNKDSSLMSSTYASSNTNMGLDGKDAAEYQAGMTSNGNGDYMLGSQQSRKANGDANGIGKYVPQVRRSLGFGGPDPADDSGVNGKPDMHGRPDLPRGYSKEGVVPASSSSEMDKRPQQKRYIRPSRATSKAEAPAASGSGEGREEGQGGSRPGSGWRASGRSMVVDKLAILKRRQESRRANSANAVLQRAKSDPTLGYYMNDPLQISNRSIFTSNSLCPPPGRYSTPRMARTARAKAQQCNITVTDSSASNSTFASGGISTPKTFRNQRSVFNSETVRSPVCRLVSSKYERNGLNDTGKPLEFATNELQPCLDPDGTLKDVLSALAIANSANRKELNWIAQYEAVTNARRLVVNHSSVVLPQLHALILAVKPALVELRSYTVKNTMMLFREIFCTLKTYADPELEHVVPSLLKKAGESSTAGRTKKTFLSQEADAVLSKMVANCNEVKSAQALLACSKHKSGTIRTKVIMHLHKVVSKSSRRVFQNRDLLDKIMSTAASYLDEPSNVTRGYSKQLFWTLGEVVPHEVRSFLNKVSDIKAKQIRNAVTNPPPATTSTGASASGTARPRSKERSGSQYAAEGKGFQGLTVDGTQRQQRAPSRSRRAGNSSSPEAEESFQETVEKIKASQDWRERYQGLQSLEKDLVRLGDVQESRLIAAFDALVPRISDGNSKVVVQALQTTSDVVRVAKNTSVVGLNVLMPALASAIGSTNEKIRQKASKTLNSLCNEVDSVYLVQNLSHCVKHSGPRSQPMLMEHLNFLVPSVYSRKQQLVNKYVVPVAFSMLNEKSTAVRMTTQKLMMTLHKSMGTQLLQLADQHLGTGMQNRLHDMLASDYM